MRAGQRHLHYPSHVILLGAEGGIRFQPKAGWMRRATWISIVQIDRGVVLAHEKIVESGD